LTSDNNIIKCKKPVHDPFKHWSTHSHTEYDKRKLNHTCFDMQEQPQTSLSNRHV